MQWFDYLVIVVFIVLALVLINVFVDAGPKKLMLMIGAALVGVVAIFWTYKRNKYSEKKLKAHNDKIKNMLDLIDERDQVIKKNNGKITELVQERESLLQETEVDQDRIKQIDESIQSSKRAHETINRTIASQEEALAKALDERDQREELPSSEEILKKHGISSARMSTSEPVADPKPTSDRQQIVINGFTMKGDAA